MVGVVELQYRALLQVLLVRIVRHFGQLANCWNQYWFIQPLSGSPADVGGQRKLHNELATPGTERIKGWIRHPPARSCSDAASATTIRCGAIP